MPRSRLRRKEAVTPRPARAAVRVGNPAWLVPAMVALFVIGLIWIVVYYVTQSGYPVPALGGWNMVVGFGLIIGGFLLATRWR